VERFKTDKKFTYVFVRQDMSQEQQAVQACHAAHESGATGTPMEIMGSTLVLIGVKNENALNQAFAECKINKIRSNMFFEPDRGGEATAFATKPILEEDRVYFSKYRTLRFKKGFLHHFGVFCRAIWREVVY
jgi:hypothetical protein